VKALLFLLLSGLKWGKLVTTGGTMLLSLAIYATIWGWPYAAGFVALMFAHEMGHFVAARQRGLDVGAPTFIPFVGAWINLRDQPHNVETEAYVAAAGPLVGTVAAVAVYLWGRSTDSGLLLAIAYAGLFLNLFNLLPLSPLDGGRITAIIDRHAADARAPHLSSEPGPPDHRSPRDAATRQGLEVRRQGAGKPRLLRRSAANQA
jgi:Zn-dependent protease